MGPPRRVGGTNGTNGIERKTVGWDTRSTLVSDDITPVDLGLGENG